MDFEDHIVNELLTAISAYEILAEELIQKLIKETDQPEKTKIEKGHYYEIENADLFNGFETLSDNWYFDVHGEHCMFKNLTTKQILEVSLGNKDSIRNIDPSFFYNFLKTTPKFNHLTSFFNQPFQDTLYFFEELERQKILMRVGSVEFSKQILR